METDKTELNNVPANSTIVENIMSMTKAEITKNIESGSLMVVTVGDENHMPCRDDIKTVSERMSELFKDTKGVKILVVPFMVNIKVYSVPQVANESLTK